MNDHAALTDRERMVAQSLVRISTIVAIAEELVVSPFTVRSHVEIMNVKTRTATTDQLVQWASGHQLCCCS